MGAEIGRGGFGVVFQALNVEVGDFVAVKRFPLTAIDAESLASIEAEIDLMKKLNHPNIVKYVDTIRTQDYLHIVLEYMENGSLQHVLKKFGSFSESLTAIYITQVLRGLKYLHEQGVLHRDIKGANILTTKDGQVKLADFGVALKLSDIQVPDGMDVVGTPYWMAPEIIEMSTPTAACDIWSVGCTIVELIGGKPPYFDLAPMAALFRIVQDDYPPLPNGISQALREFLLLCFHKEPTMRSTATKLLEHPWLQNPSNHLNKTDQLLTSKTHSESIDDETQGIVNTVKLFREDMTIQFKAADLAAQLAAQKAREQQEPTVQVPREEATMAAPSPPRFLKDSSSSLEDDMVDGGYSDIPASSTADDDNASEDWDADFADNKDSDNVETIRLSGSKFNTGNSSVNIKHNSGADGSRGPVIRGLSIASAGDISEFIDASPIPNAQGPLLKKSTFAPETNGRYANGHGPARGKQHVRNNTHVSVGGLMSSLAKYQDDDEDDNVESSFLEKESAAPGSTIANREPLELKKRDIHASADHSEPEDIDEFLNYQFDDNDFQQNENKDGHTRRSQKIIQWMEHIKSDTEDADVVDICQSILKEFEEFPEQREHLITHHGVLPVLNMLEATTADLLLGGALSVGGNTQTTAHPKQAGRPYVLRVINEIIEGSVRAQEQLSLVGVIPVVMRQLDYNASLSHTPDSPGGRSTVSSIDPVVLEAARFVHQISSTSSLTLQMLIGAGGLPVLVHMGPVMETATSEDARRMVYMGVDCIMQVFSVQSSRTRDFCLLFVKLGLLSHLGVAFEYVMAFDRRQKNTSDVTNMTDTAIKAEEMQCKYALRIATILWNFSRYEVAEQMGKGGLLDVIMKILQSPSLVNSNSSNPYFGKQKSASATTPIIFAEIVELLLKCIKNLSMEPTATALQDLEHSGAIETLVGLLNGPLRDRCKNHVVPCMFNLCRINKKRQEKAAVSGLIPFLQQLVNEESHLRQFALPILFDLAHTSAVTRAELWKNDVAVLYMNLLRENYWQTQALISLNIWCGLYADTTAVEAVMTEPQNLSKLVGFFRTASTQTINTLHKPLLDIMTKSKKLARALAISGLYVSALVKRLVGSEAIVLRSLLRMLQLLHLHHPFPRQFVLDHNLYAIVRSFAQDESQVLVFQMANRLLRDFQSSTIS
ncbi:unnamed protein product [Ectocarpus fasciculatus]